ncbi:MAG: UPF0280 family protein [Hyphomicrobiaceae bacterium]
MPEAAVALGRQGNPVAPHRALLGDGRLHLQDGPIDLVVEAFGAADGVAAAYRAAADRFEGLLGGLCTELAELRRPVAPGPCRLHDPIARRMHEAVAPYATRGLITPMAAVAGAVAEAILAAMIAAGEIDRAYVNNGGDIALHLAPGQAFDIGLVDRPDRPSLFARARLSTADGIGGIATSGWRGRSFSLGIADAVTVLAGHAADADAAATIIANAVDLPNHPGILRQPADQLQPDTDLGPTLVTRAVPDLSPTERACALDAGAETAGRALRAARVRAVALHLQGETRIVGHGLTALPEASHA